jgi:hypothetical protein
MIHLERWYHVTRYYLFICIPLYVAQTKTRLYVKYFEGEKGFGGFGSVYVVGSENNNIL